MNKNNCIASFLQNIFSKLWNIGLFENMDSFKAKPFSHLIEKSKKPMLYRLRKKLHALPHCQPVSFVTRDGVLLDGICFHPERKKVILFAAGIGSLYENLADPKSVMSRFKTFFSCYFPDHALFVFNSRGIGASEGCFDLKHLPLDTIGAYAFLKDKWGFELGDILLYAHSLGGLHATIGAAEVQKEHPAAALSVISDRSLGNLSQFTRASAGNFAAGVVKKLGLDLCAKQAWKELKGKKLIIASRRDKTIPYREASFVYAVDASKVIYLDECASLKEHHTRSFTTKEASEISSAILA